VRGARPRGAGQDRCAAERGRRRDVGFGWAGSWRFEHPRVTTADPELLGCRSMMHLARSCAVRVVRTDPWLVCEIQGVRVVLPRALGMSGDPACGAWLLVSDWAIDELTREAAGGLAPAEEGRLR